METPTLLLFAEAILIWFLLLRAAPERAPGDNDVFVEIFRCDMGQGYNP